MGTRRSTYPLSETGAGTHDSSEDDLEAEQNTAQVDNLGRTTVPRTVFLLVARGCYPLWGALSGVPGIGWLIRQAEDDDYRQSLASAQIAIPASLYLAGIFGVSLLAGGAGAIVGGGAAAVALALGGPAFASTLGPGVTIAGGGILTGATLGAVAAVTGYRYPKFVARHRAREIDLALPDMVSFLYALSVNEPNVLELFQAAADTEEAFGEIATEFARINHKMEYFDEDYQRAIETVAETTPSDRFANFLTNFLSFISEGGDPQEWLETQRDQQNRAVRRQQEYELEQTEFASQFYMALAMFPILLLIVLTIVRLLGQGSTLLLGVTVYLVVPAVALVYLLLVATIKTDDIGTGRISGLEDSVVTARETLTGTPVADHYAALYPDQFGEIRQTERRYAYRRAFANLDDWFRERPTKVLWVTAPATAAVLVGLVVTGTATLSPKTFVTNHTSQTLYWGLVPFAMNAVPVAVFYELKQGERSAVTETLTSDLRKLATANRMGDSLVSSFGSVADQSDSRLASEFGILHKKTQYGQALDESLVVLTNRYSIPRLGRLMKLVQKAHETSTQISEVLETAAELSETQDELLKQRRSATFEQFVITAAIFGVLVLVVMLFEVFFAPVISQTSSSSNYLAVTPFQQELMGMLRLHMILLFGIWNGFVSGYVRTTKLYSGLKYAVGYAAVGYGAWVLGPPLAFAIGLTPTVPA